MTKSMVRASSTGPMDGTTRVAGSRASSKDSANTFRRTVLRDSENGKRARELSGQMQTAMKSRNEVFRKYNSSNYIFLNIDLTEYEMTR
jgi:hypothetical protein